jgi:hypothetical protein
LPYSMRIYKGLVDVTGVNRATCINNVLIVAYTRMTENDVLKYFVNRLTRKLKLT